ncbi:hypothetical protein OR16_07646 [Cupriavidus basilensis OR16]|uniref:Uncharacterized protein n=1 Tax=Cupriavidus basilensis OR16 TaxID=1127483 RepID=H1S1J0_9BURK|nr:hypothetical protein [Cupriavidus basilensis]EHP43565.1 hypothetical protein OR16_07646 [Cupriavidus basilensis OR16]
MRKNKLIQLAVGGLTVIVAIVGIRALSTKGSPNESDARALAARRSVIDTPTTTAQQSAVATLASNPAALAEGADLESLQRYGQRIISDATLTPEQKFDLLWRDFESTHRSPTTAQYLLDTMRLLSLPPSAATAARIEASLWTVHAEPVKRSLVNLLASQYETDLTLSVAEQSRLGANPQVAAMLAKAARSSDTEIAHQAVMQYARMGLFPDSIPILDAALSGGAISRAEYAKEMGFLLPLIQEPEAQRQALQAIWHAGVPSELLAEDLAAMVLLPHALSSLHAETLRPLQDLLAQGQPAFANNAGLIDFLDLARYSDWLSASAAIEARLSGGSAAAHIATLVMRENADPRGLIAIVASPSAEQVIHILAQRGQTEAARQRLAKLALGAPNDVTVLRMIEEAQNRIVQRQP